MAGGDAKGERVCMSPCLVSSHLKTMDNAVGLAGGKRDRNADDDNNGGDGAATSAYVQRQNIGHLGANTHTHRQLARVTEWQGGRSEDDDDDHPPV